MRKKFRVLIVDDEEAVREALTDWLSHRGYLAEAVGDGPGAIDKVKKAPWDALLVDLKMPDMDGIQVLREVRSVQPEAPVIIITAYATVDSAVQAMKDGAYDYVVKPFEPDEISLILQKLSERKRLIEENVLLRQELTGRYHIGDIIGKSEKMQEIFDLMRSVADTNTTVLVQGESGTGKELVVRVIHEMSQRRTGPFVPVSCGALAETLLESELFGHEKGAFTGATDRKKGRFELAHGGTLFLDEIADISPKTQLNLLRAIEQKELMRVGGTEPIKVNVRIIAATNKNLAELVTQGKFREDLYYRLKSFVINLSPLRERKEDIPLLTTHFLERFNIEMRKEIKRLSEEAMSLLMQYSWPGNVRELRHAVEHAMVVCKGPIVPASDIPPEIRGTQRQPLETIRPLWEMEKEYIAEALRINNWNISLTAKMLEIDRETLYNKIKRYTLQRPAE